MRADILSEIVAAAAQAPQASSELGWHTGQILSWDNITGVNSVLINGNTFNNLKVLTSGAGVIFTAGDVVGIIRVQTNYFILGRVAAPGAGAALATRAATVAGSGTISGGTTGFMDLSGSFGPQLSNVYISSAKRCLVFGVAQVKCTQAIGTFDVECAGIPAGTQPGIMVNSNTQNSADIAIHEYTLMGSRVFTESDGLTQGMKTFTMKYMLTGNSASSVVFSQRRVIVIPF